MYLYSFRIENSANGSQNWVDKSLMVSFRNRPIIVIGMVLVATGFGWIKKILSGHSEHSHILVV